MIFLGALPLSEPRLQSSDLLEGTTRALMMLDGPPVLEPAEHNFASCF